MQGTHDLPEKHETVRGERCHEHTFDEVAQDIEALIPVADGLWRVTTGTYPY